MEFLNDRHPRARLTAQDDIFALGYVTSMFALELVVYVEETFGFTVPRPELAMRNFRSAAAIARLVDSHVGPPSAPAPSV